MDVLTVRHLTRYRYAMPVAFGEHRMMFRPRESFDQHVLESSLTISPKPADCALHARRIRQLHRHRAFRHARRRNWSSKASYRLEHTPEDSLDDPSSPDRGLNSYPFAYRPIDLPDVHSSMLRGYPDPGSHSLDNWSRRFLQGLPKVDAPNVLAAMTHAIHDELKYVGRSSGPPQTPLETLRLGRGTCRDFAVLMMEAVRTLGLAARFVSGYHLCSRAARMSQRHGWAAGTLMPGFAFFFPMAAGRNSIPQTALSATAT